MAKSFESTCTELKRIIDNAYTEGVTITEAERLAALTLSLRLEISDYIRTSDLDARMKKHGVKAIRGQAYLEEISKHEKKPTESYLEASVNNSELVDAAERLFAEADTANDRLIHYLDIFKDAHIYFRTIARGTYE